MDQPPFHRPTRLEEIYRNELDKLYNKYFQFPTVTTLGEINARLVEFAHARNFFSAFGRTLAKRMITQVAAGNAISWRHAASQSSNGRSIYRMLNAELTAPGLVGMHVSQLIEDNARLIGSIPENIQVGVAKFVQQQFVRGIRADEIVSMLGPRLNHLKRYEIQRIARTEVAKADTAITRARAQAIGFNWYQWHTSEDARVRPAHRKMNLVLVNWNDAPAPEQLAGLPSEGHYHAGNIWNCRCPAVTITDLREIRWPCKVYINNSIRRLTRPQFVLMSGLPKELAA